MAWIRTSTIAPLLIAALVFAAGCDRDERADPSSGTANGDVTFASYESLEGALGGEVSSEQYRKWMRAKQALDRLGKLPAPVRATSGVPSGDEIERAVQRWEQNPRVRQAIEGAGMTVREYILTTVALDRAMAATTRPAPAPAAAAAPVLADSAAYPPAYPPAYSQPYPVEAAPVPVPEAQPSSEPLPGTARAALPGYTPATSSPAPVTSAPRPGRDTQPAIPPARGTVPAPLPTPLPPPTRSDPARAPTPAPAPAPVPPSSGNPAAPPPAPLPPPSSDPAAPAPAPPPSSDTTSPPVVSSIASPARADV